MSVRSGLLVATVLVLFTTIACDTTDAPDGGIVEHDAGPPPADCKVTAPTACPSPAPTYDDIAPIVQQHCTGCHSDAPNGGPWPLTDYTHVSDWSDDIRTDMIYCSMPPADAGITITTAEREKLLAWIRCGKPK